MFFPLCRRGLQYLFNEVVIWLPYNFALSEVLALPRCNTDFQLSRLSLDKFLEARGARASASAVCCQPVARDGRFTWILYATVGHALGIFEKHCMSGFFFEIPSLDVMTVH